MENASKALIIAGAILIAIVLIAVGVLVVNNMNEPVEQGVAGMDDQAKQIFNRKFENYQSTNQNANNVKALISAIRASNSSDTQINKVKVICGSTTSDPTGDAANWETKLTTISGTITTAKTYKVEFGYTSGVITQCTITPNP